MSIWIFALLLLVLAALAGWRQGAIRAAFGFGSILLGALLASPLGHLFHPLLPHLGMSHSPILAWALAPVLGFIIGSIPLIVVGQVVHNRVEHYYKYNAGDLRLALWSRLNIRTGICIGLLNGMVYVILISFFIYNFAYWTSQAVKDPSASDQALPIRVVNSLGAGLESTGFAKTACAVGSLPARFYKLADFSGLLMQNPQLASRLADYPGLVSLWHRPEMQELVTDPTVTNALADGTSLNQLLGATSVQDMIANKDLTKMVDDAVETNLDDLTAYLNTGKSAKYGGEPLIGNWVFNASVTLAWLRQEQPKMGANEMRAIRALWTMAYAQTSMLMTGDNQIYVKNLPKFVTPTQPTQPPFLGEDWNGDWSRDGANYTLHVSLNGQEKYLTATTDADGLRLRVKDGHTLLVFDHVN